MNWNHVLAARGRDSGSIWTLRLPKQKASNKVLLKRGHSHQGSGRNFFNVLEKCFFFKPHALVLHLNEGKHGVYKPKDKEKRDLV